MAQTKVKDGLLNFPDRDDFIQLPSGTTAQRPSSPEQGYSRYNTTDKKLEFWNGTLWQQLPGVVAPIITSVSYPGDDLAADPAGGQTITINGSDFKTGATVTVGGTTPSVITFVSATEITFEAPAKAAGDYDIVVTNVDGGNATAVNGMSYNGVPSWTTAAGNLGTFPAGSTIPTITLVATEPDSGTISYSVTTGALPTGLTLTGADIDGSVPTPAGETTYNFSVTASDDENQESTERAFNIVVYLQVTNTVSEVDPFGDSSGVALYRLENNANDEGGVYNGTPTNVTYGTGVFGQAGVFNGSSSYATLPSILNIDSQRVTFSVSLWLKINTPRLSGIFNDYSGTGGYNMIFEGQTNGTVRIFNNFAAGVSMDTPNLNDSSWHNVIVMNDATNNIQYLYVDGYFHNSQVLSTGTKVNSTGIFIGKYNISGGYFFDGSLDQIRIFNRVLDPLEVSSLYQERVVLCGGQAETVDILGDNSCIALYPLDGNANDLSGNYSGTPTNVSYGVGEFDLAGVFNGSSSYVITQRISAFNIQDFTSSAWIYITSSGSYQVITSTYEGSPNPDRAWSFRLTSANNLEFSFTQTNGTNISYTTTEVLSLNTWYNVVASKTSSSVALYINGSQVLTSSASSVLYFSSTPTLGIGRLNQLGVQYFNGSIDQVRIFNKALSSSEVTTLYNETACDVLACSGTTNTLDILGDSSCIAAYPLDGSPLDLSGNYNGVQTDVNYPVGKFDLGGSFNGSTSKISHNLKWQTNSSFSFSVWVKPTTTPTSGLKTILMNVNNNTDQTGAIFYTEGNQIAFIATTSNGSWTDLGLYLFAPSPTGGVWTNYVIVKDGSTLRAYTNGSLTKSVSCSAGAFATSSLQEIGGNAGNPGFASNFWNGQIDQVRIFNKALSAGEVTTLYNETACN